jgi:hypothetical protein
MVCCREPGVGHRAEAGSSYEAEDLGEPLTVLADLIERGVKSEIQISI